MVIANYPELNNNLTLDLLANDIALSVRQAQQYALGVRQESISGVTQSPSYGLHFDLGAQNPNSYILFADVTTPGGPGTDYLFNGTDPSVGSATLPGGMIIKRLCVRRQSMDPALLDQCLSYLAGSATVQTLDVVYKRPNPDANINGVAFNGADPFVEAIIVLRSVRGSTTKKVHIYQSGQIAVES